MRDSCEPVPEVIPIGKRPNNNTIKLSVMSHERVLSKIIYMLPDRVFLVFLMLLNGSNESSENKCSRNSYVKPLGAMGASQVTWVLGVHSQAGPKPTQA
jgi:hypothetical protein